MTRAAHVRDVLAVARRFGLAGKGTVLVGQSMGGLTALLTAAAHPEVCRALVLIEAGPAGPAPELPEQIGSWLDSWPVPFPDMEAAEAFFGGGPAGRAWAAGLAPGPGGLHPRVDRDVMVATVRENAHHDYWDAWDRVRCPALVLRGESGTMKPDEADRMRARHPATRIAVIPGRATTPIWTTRRRCTGRWRSTCVTSISDPRAGVRSGPFARGRSHAVP